jgi:hypothetical protein
MVAGKTESMSASIVPNCWAMPRLAMMYCEDDKETSKLRVDQYRIAYHGLLRDWPSRYFGNRISLESRRKHRPGLDLVDPGDIGRVKTGYVFEPIDRVTSSSRFVTAGIRQSYRRRSLLKST